MQELVSPDQLRKMLPLNADQLLFLQATQKSIADAFTTSSKKFIIAGPCSIHDPESALFYAQKLHSLSEKVKDHFMVLMRVHVEKPRTKNSWRGFLYDPYLDGSYNIEAGLELSRKLMLDIISIGIPISCELLDPLLFPYFSDLISWGMIGARTVSSPNHRLLASSCKIPVGFKNPLDGDLHTAVHAISVARSSQHLLTLNDKGILSKMKTDGNPFAHLVLRGSSYKSNFDYETMRKAESLLVSEQIPSKVLVDCAHGNCVKSPQSSVFEKVIDEHMQLHTPLLGVMLESYLKEGAFTGTDIFNAPKDLSITDYCISYAETEELILKAQSKLINSNQSLCLNC